MKNKHPPFTKTYTGSKVTPALEPAIGSKVIEFGNRTDLVIEQIALWKHQLSGHLSHL